MDKIIDQLDTEDICSVLGGNPEAFSNIVQRYTTPLYNLSYRMLGNSEDAEEAVQEIFLRIYRKINKYDIKKSFYSWMFTLALNYLRSVLRKSRNSKMTHNRVFDENILTDYSDTGFETPEDNYIRKEAGKAVDSALLQLPLKYREVFVLREVEGFSVKETADILKIPENTVKTLSRRGKDKLKKNIYLSEWK